MFNISVLLDGLANLPETNPFFSAQMALVSTFFQMFIVLGMYNFGFDLISLFLPKIPTIKKFTADGSGISEQFLKNPARIDSKSSGFSSQNSSRILG